jgi:hypothetical protein
MKLNKSPELFVAIFLNFFLVSLLRNHTSKFNDHNNKNNILPQLVVPTILFQFSQTIANSLVISDVYWYHYYQGVKRYNFNFSFLIHILSVCPGKSYIRGKLSTVDLLVLTSSDKLIFMLKILFKFL